MPPSVTHTRSNKCRKRCARLRRTRACAGSYTSSTASVHGQAPPFGATETSSLHTRHVLAYNNAKVRAERTFFQECSCRGLEGFALRPGLVYGPRSRWIADAAADLRNHQAWLLGDGLGIFNGIYVDNLYAAILASLQAPSEAAGAYLVGDERTTTWQDFYLHDCRRPRGPSRAYSPGGSPSGLHAPFARSPRESCRQPVRAHGPNGRARLPEAHGRKYLRSRPVPASVKQAIGDPAATWKRGGRRRAFTTNHLGAGVAPTVPVALSPRAGGHQARLPATGQLAGGGSTQPGVAGVCGGLPLRRC